MSDKKQTLPDEKKNNIKIDKHNKKSKKSKNKFLKVLKKKIRKSSPYLLLSLFLILTLVVVLWKNIFIFIKPGEAGVLWERFGRGTYIEGQYDEGFHMIFPWDIMYIYNIRNQVVNESIDILTNNGLTIQLYIAIRFRPEKIMLTYLHKNIGPDYQNVIILPQIKSVIRRTIGKYNPEQLYTDAETIIEEIVHESTQQVGNKYISIDDVLIKNIALPEKIKIAIETKLEQKQKAEEYEFRLLREEQEARRKEIEAGGIRKFQELVKSNLDSRYLKWKGISVTGEIARSDNAKVIIIGSGENGLPVILNTEGSPGDLTGEDAGDVDGAGLGLNKSSITGNR